MTEVKQTYEQAFDMAEKIIVELYNINTTHTVQKVEEAREEEGTRSQLQVTRSVSEDTFRGYRTMTNKEKARLLIDIA